MTLRRRLGVVAAASALVASSVAMLAIAKPYVSASENPASKTSDTGVAVVTYNLGDTAFKFRDAGPNELAGVVHYPRSLAIGTHPLMLQLHGSWWSCNDKAAWARAQQALEAGDDEEYFRAVQPMGAWPCRRGTPPLPSNRGYDYLGQALARQGFVVVSIGANGINSNEGSWGYEARAALVNKHLAMWQQLAARGAGALRGAFVDPATGRRKDVPFTGHVDMANVGTLGHSRGGKGVMWQAADRHRRAWPKGVQVKAVMPYAAVHFDIPPEDEVDPDGLVTRMPIGVVTGDCDGIGMGGLSYIDDAKGRNTSGMYGFTIHGANHNFFNTEWSPRSGNAGAVDAPDVDGFPAICAEQPDAPGGRPNEQEQRTVATTYVVAFFRWALLGDRSVEPILTGATLPHADITNVDVRVVPPAAPSKGTRTRR